MCALHGGTAPAAPATPTRAGLPPRPPRHSHLRAAVSRAEPPGVQDFRTAMGGEPNSTGAGNLVGNGASTWITNMSSP
eukprot:2569651-Amphidinium_carterae.1